jgi:hypothetical protein
MACRHLARPSSAPHHGELQRGQTVVDSWRAVSEARCVDVDARFAFNKVNAAVTAPADAGVRMAF